MAFPTTGVLDNFNRADEGPPPSASWGSSGINNASASLAVVSNTAKDNGTFRGAWWGTSVGPDSEVYGTFPTLWGNGATYLFYLRLVTPGSVAVDGYQLRFGRNDGSFGLRSFIYRVDNNVATQLGTNAFTGVNMAAGIKVGADIVGSTITTYTDQSGSWASLYTNTDATYGAAGFIGVLPPDTTAALDDFGGGTIGTPAADNQIAWITA